MELGRKGDLVAKTPFLTFPPSLGGRTVGDHFVLFASENSQISQRWEYSSMPRSASGLRNSGVSDQVFTAWFGKEKFGVASGGMEKGSPEVGGRMQGSRPNGRS